MAPPYHDLRHPLIFYYGHPAVLYVNKLRVAGFIDKPINSHFESIFETGVDEMSWDDLSKNKMKWPSVEEVHDYRKQVYEKVSKIISNIEENSLNNLGINSPLWALFMSFEHERIHIETSSVLIAELPQNLVRFPEGMVAYHPTLSRKSSSSLPHVNVDYPQNEMIHVPSKQVKVGKDTNFPSYGWDNEYGSRTFTVPEFKASKFKITNGEFHEFVRDNGYSDKTFWTEVGWKWRAFRNSKWPSFWVSTGPQGLHQFDLRLIFDTVPMNWSLPVSVNYHEAAAFAKWKSSKTGKKYRILTELEHHSIRDSSVDDPVVSAIDGRLTNKYNMNLNLSYSSMSSVNAYPPNNKGFHDVFGNAWEWTEDYFCPFPGFQIHPYYEDFSTPCFDGLHNVIQGGSFISTGNEASKYSRFHFRPHFFQHASFRIVEQVAEHMVTTDLDAPGPYVGEYPFRRSAGGTMKAIDKEKNINFNILLAKHFGSLSTNFNSSSSNSNSNISAVIYDRITQNYNKFTTPLANSNVLEVGCGPGSLSHLLSSHVRAVVGIDHDLENINYAKNLIRTKNVEYILPGSNSPNIVQLKSSSNVLMEFRQSDPMCLPAELKEFDIVVLNDVIDKISSPNALLGRLGGSRGLVKKDGLLVVVTALEWKEEITPKSLWLQSSDILIDRLSEEFNVISYDGKSIFWHDSAISVKGKFYNFVVLQRK